MEEVQVKRVYRHFKGKYYYVLSLAKHSETGEEFVVYQALYGENTIYIRPMSMFLEKIDLEHKDNITKQQNRFELADINKEDIK